MKHCHQARLVILSAILFVTGCTFGSNSGGSSGGSSNGSGSGTSSTGPLATITVSPISPANLLVGAAQQFTATAKDSNGNTLTGVTFTWTSTVTSVATVNNTGLATAIAPGSTFIVASVGAIFSTASPVVNVATTLAFNTTNLPLGATNIAYIATGLTNSGAHSGGFGPFTWTLLNGTTLPPGLTLSSNGSISGSPTTTGTTNFTVKITDSETQPVSQQAALSITVVDPVNSPCSVITDNDPGILHGNYAFLLQGFQGGTTNGTPAAIAGGFVANGSGGITGGEEDLNLAAGAQHLTITGGSYAVNTGGQGCVQLTYSGGATTGAVFHFALSLVLNGSNIATHGRIIEFDAYQGSAGGTATKLASGVIRLQDTSEFATASLASRYAFGMDGFNFSGGHAAIGGSFSLNTTSGSITSLFQDVDSGGSVKFFTGQTGAVTTVATSGTTGTAETGRELVSIIISGGGTTHFAGYIVNTNELFLVSTDTLAASTPILSGRAIVTAGSYTQSSLSGNYIFHGTAVDYQGDGNPCAASGPCVGVEVAQVNANSGTGAFTGTDIVSQAGVEQTSSIANATYLVAAATGRVVISSPGGPSILYIATPMTGTDPSEPIAAFLVASGTSNTTGDPTAPLGFVEAQPSGPYALNSPPSYVLGMEDPGQIGVGYIVSAGSFSSGTVAVNQDLSNLDGLVINRSVSVTLPINGDGTITTTTTVGVTNSTSATPGKALFFGPAAMPNFVRVLEP
jgi:hypothetical protein